MPRQQNRSSARHVLQDGSIRSAQLMRAEQVLDRVEQDGNFGHTERLTSSESRDVAQKAKGSM
jgi:hypothetical protein